MSELLCARFDVQSYKGCPDRALPDTCTTVADSTVHVLFDCHDVKPIASTLLVALPGLVDLVDTLLSPPQ